MLLLLTSSIPISALTFTATAREHNMLLPNAELPELAVDLGALPFAASLHREHQRLHMVC